MLNTSYHSTPPTLFRTRNGNEVFRPDPKRPEMDDSEDIYRAPFEQMLGRAEDRQLEGWVYHDTFLSFLHTIGPANAALIRELSFGGMCKLHRGCSREYCSKQCDEDLVVSLQYYIPFIKKFCPGLKKLVLYADEDSFYINDPYELSTGKPATREEALLPLLMGDLRQISSLKELEVYDGMCTDQSPLAFAEPAIQWFKERAAEEIRSAREEFLRLKLE